MFWHQRQTQMTPLSTKSKPSFRTKVLKTDGFSRRRVFAHYALKNKGWITSIGFEKEDREAKYSRGNTLELISKLKIMAISALKTQIKAVLK